MNELKMEKPDLQCSDLLGSSPVAVYYLPLVFVSLLVRWIVSLNTYSGYRKPPMYGDYEAQRHWMEITANLPLGDWYANTTNNDLLYWGLDYPPLTAYHSFLNGWITSLFNSSWNTLHVSRGLEDPLHKLFMRSTVVFSDLVFYIPPLLLLHKHKGHISKSHSTNIFNALVLSLLNPGLILIDHGHFQYNCISLGLTFWAVYAIYIHRPFLASVFFCLALNYKQMELYHAVPFFIYLLRLCFASSKIASKLYVLVRLCLTVLVTFTLCWLPFLMRGDSESILQILRRVFPFNRGLFEDKVGNVWCSLHPVLRVKEKMALENVLRLCFVSTVMTIIPDCYLLWKFASPKNLVRCLVSTSLSFFLFSFHVHEKSVLLATAPASLLLLDHPLVTGWFLTIATGSMFPLLLKDGLLLPTISLSLLFLLLLRPLLQNRESNPDQVVLTLHREIRIPDVVVSAAPVASVVAMASLCGLHVFVAPPPRYPDLFTYLIAAFSCAHFLAFKMLYLSFIRKDETLEKAKKNV